MIYDVVPITSELHLLQYCNNNISINVLPIRLLNEFFRLSCFAAVNSSSAVCLKGTLVMHGKRNENQTEKKG